MKPRSAIHPEITVGVLLDIHPELETAILDGAGFCNTAQPASATDRRSVLCER